MLPVPQILLIYSIMAKQAKVKIIHANLALFSHVLYASVMQVNIVDAHARSLVWSFKSQP